MSGLDILVFVVMGVLLSAGLYVAIRLGALPGRIAKSRNHPQADAIQVAGWLGILTLGLLWPFALVWAFSRPLSPASADPALQPLSVSTDFPGGSGRVLEIDQAARAVRLVPTPHQDRGWSCWWSRWR